MATSETLRSVIDAGRTSRRLDELSAARVIGKAAQQVHAAQQKAGAGKAVGPISPTAIGLAPTGEVALALVPTTATSYAAPEQTSGAAGDRRSDVFSLGVVMWEALTHQRLFEAMNDAAVKVAINEREIRPPAEVNANIPVELSAICMRALARNPADRYQSAKSMGVEIEEFLEEAGYADNDEQIAAVLSELGKPKVEKKLTLPPPTRIAPTTTPPATAPAPAPAAAAPIPAAAAPIPAAAAPIPAAAAPIPAAAAPAAAAPSMLKTPPGAATAVHAPNDKMTTAPGLGPAVLVTPAATAATAPAANARTANGTSPPPGAAQAAPPAPAAPIAAPLVPMPPVLPGAAVAKPEPDTNGAKSATPANGEAAKTSAAEPAKPVVEPVKAVVEPVKAVVEPAKPVVEPAKPVAEPAKPDPSTNLSQTMMGIGIMATAPAAAPATPALEAPPASATLVGPPGVAATATPIAARPDVAAPSAPMGATESSPNPASVVALPGRESKDVLAGWGWGTDAHEAIDDDDVHAPQTNSRKLLIYLIGGGVVFATMIAIIAFGFGGSKKKQMPPPPTAATQEGSAAAGAPGTPDTTGSSATGAVAAADTTGSAGTSTDATGVGSAVAAAGSATDTTGTAGSAPGTVATDTTGTSGSASTGSTGSAAVAATTTAGAATTGTAAVATTGPVNPYPDTPDTTKKPEITKPDITKPDVTKPDTTRKPDITKPDTGRTTTAKKPDTTKAITTAKSTKPDTGRTTKPDAGRTTKPDKGPSAAAKAEKTGEAEAAYKAGIMQFARGDTTGALAQLRTALAANPNYAPTWRGLGLIFEKLGEKDQARAAFKRYLQLAPGATDGEQVRSRMERLGS